MSFRLTPALQPLRGVSLATLVVLYFGCVRGQSFDDDMMEPGMSSILAYSNTGHQEMPSEAIGYNLPMEEDEEDGPAAIVPTVYSPVSPPFLDDIGTNQTGVSNATAPITPELRNRPEMKTQKGCTTIGIPSLSIELPGLGTDTKTGPAGPPGTQADIGPAVRRSGHPGNPTHQPQHSNLQSGHSRMPMSFPTPTPTPVVQHMPPYQGTITHT